MNRYTRWMELLYRAVLALTGLILVAMVSIITWQVFSRFVLNRTPYWSEETTLVLMIYFGFLGAAAVYRKRLHIGIKFFLNALRERVQRRIYFFIDLALGLFALFMIVYGIGLSGRMMRQTLPALQIKVGYSYLAIPLGGAILLLFVIEKVTGHLEHGEG